MIKKGDLLDYGLTIFQDNNNFKFNLDSVLLAEFVKIKKKSKILDVCSGNAVIPLILLTKESDLLIDCVEIQKSVCDIAKKNISINNYDAKVNVINNNLNNLSNNNYYDIIVCNPPYYKNNNKMGNSIQKNISKHEIHTNIEEIIRCSKRYLNPKGKLNLIFKTTRLPELISLLKKYNFGILNITFIVTKKDSINLFLVEAQKSKKDNTKVNYVYIKNVKTYKNLFN